jgi:hypothetical protein
VVKATEQATQNVPAAAEEIDQLANNLIAARCIASSSRASSMISRIW